MILDIIGLLVWSVFMVIARAIMFVPGLFLVPLGLHFSTIKPGSRIHFDAFLKSQYWYLKELPWWLWPWSNKRDGARGDRHGSYIHHQCPRWIIRLDQQFKTDFFKEYNWLALRNMHNNFARYTRGTACPTYQARVELLAGVAEISAHSDRIKTGYSFTKATGTLFSYWGFYTVVPIYKDYYVIARLGHKINLEHSNKYFGATDPELIEKSWKGWTIRLKIKALK
jgi:hypothetical protein